MSRLIPLILLAGLLVAGCNDDDCPQCPAPVSAPTLANIWPHADGTSWVYDGQLALYPGPEVSETPAELPSMAELHAALQDPVPGQPDSLDTGLYRLAFAGNLTTDSGMTAQDLTETWYVEAAPSKSLWAAPADRDRDFLRLLAGARPDLRVKMASLYGLGPEEPGKVLPPGHDPYFLSAYAFAYEDSGYYGYGDLDQRHAWAYLAGDLSVGSEFSIQLVPALADDIWLYGRIWSVGTYAQDGHTWTNAVEVMYLVDLGLQEEVDENGDPLGYSRPLMYGVTVFVPEVGPVACLERHELAPSHSAYDTFPGVTIDFRFSLAAGN